MRTVAKEILDIYHGTRQKKSPDTYNNLREQYKKILYGLHGIFINIRKPEYGDANIIANRSITVHDVYHYIKSLPPNQLRQLYYDRMHMLECEIYNDVLDKQCLDTLTLSTLMFQNII